MRPRRQDGDCFYRTFVEAGGGLRLPGFLRPHCDVDDQVKRSLLVVQQLHSPPALPMAGNPFHGTTGQKNIQTP